MTDERVALIEQPVFAPVKIQLGSLAYLHQGEELVILEPATTLEISNRLAVWATRALTKDQTDD